MKHTDWLRLQTEGENICAVLRQQNYQCLKQTRRLSWKITKEGISYLLTWLPAPVSEWSLIPNQTTPTREKLWNLVQSTLKAFREGEVITYQRTSQPEDFSRPWAIMRLLPDLRRYTVARFQNRQDAHDHLRFLNRVIPTAKFEVIFDVPSDVEG
ncbi:MAG: hypothetical protein LDL41_24240 [Coleofasciculus sp. S288]|nr:hypothetical protein [Coleofasciculus sp. S288]